MIRSKIYSLLNSKFGNDFVDQLSAFNEYRVIELKREQAFGVYIIRSRIQKESKAENYLFGYDELLSSLDAFGENYVLVHTFLSNSDLFLFITDVKMKILVGHLSSKPTIL